MIACFSTIHLGPELVLVAEIQISDGLDTDQVEDLLERVIPSVVEKVQEVTETFPSGE